MNSEQLTEVFNDSVQIYSQSPLSGGDINAVFKLKTNRGVFCLKQNDRSRYLEMLQKEANGLNKLRQHSQFHVPQVIATFEDKHSQYLLMEYVELGSKSSGFWEDFGGKLANMHQQSSEQFGWQEDNYIGSLKQTNTQHSDWASFYREERILPQIRLAFDSQKVDLSFVQKAEKLCSKLHEIFPTESPALLHGDLWSGNFMINSEGNPVLIDPAIYYGHREMDLGMMHLFGGFSDYLFHTYNEHFPLEKDWTVRIPLTQLYPLLVHVNLFGGDYVRSAHSVIQRYS